jgi:hypothetical protein
MGVLSTLIPDNIIIIVNFSAYDSKSSKKHVPNTTRRVLMGERSKWSLPSLPEEVSKRAKRGIIEPVYFALIKRPKKYAGNKLDNIARGAMGIYRYIGATDETSVKEVLKYIEEVCLHLKGKEYLHWFDFEILVARRESYG